MKGGAELRRPSSVRQSLPPSPEGEGYKVFLSFNAALVCDALHEVFLAVEEEQQ